MKHTLMRYIAAIFVLASLAYAQAPANGKHFLWKAKDKDSEVWLLGSIHMAPKGLYPLPAVMDSAFRTANELAVEININNDTTVMQVAQAMMLNGTYTKGDQLSKHVSKNMLQRLDSVFRAYDMPPEAMHSMQPWLIALRIGMVAIQNTGAASEQGIDLHFMQAAETAKKPVVALETAAQQMALFQGLPDSLQEIMLEWTLDETIDVASTLDSMFAIWKRGDTLAMEALVMGEAKKDARFDAFYNRLYTQRNIGMANKVDGFLRANRKVIVVVGSAHLVGAESVPALLRKKGYTVEQW